MLCSVAVG